MRRTTAFFLPAVSIVATVAETLARNAIVLPGRNCGGALTPFRKYESVMKEDPAIWECVLFRSADSYRDFVDRCAAEWEECRERLVSPTNRLVNKADWKSYTNDAGIDATTWGPQFVHDGVVRESTGQAYHAHGQVILQITLPREHYVTRIDLELRFGCCGEHNSYIEGRVGTSDSTGLAGGEVPEANEVCFEADSSEAPSRTHECPRPLRGRYLTFQKRQPPGANGSIYVNEVEVFVVNL